MFREKEGRREREENEKEEGANGRVERGKGQGKGKKGKGQEELKCLDYIVKGLWEREAPPLGRGQRLPVTPCSR